MKLRLAPKQAKRLAAAGFGMAATSVLAVVGVTVLLAGKAESVPDIVHLPVLDEALSGRSEEGGLRVMSLNLAHGRSDGRNQALQRTSTIRGNLDEIVTLLQRTKPDLIGLQEADGPSFWSGRFSHSAYLGKASAYRYLLPGRHVQGGMLEYGAALLSRPSLSDPASEMEVDVVSVHLDFARRSNRQRQVDKMINILSERKRPLIVMGDFNCEWENRTSAIRRLATGLQLRTVESDRELAVTFRGTGQRLDWILVSSEFEFRSYEVLPDVVSDHQPMVAWVDLR